VIYPDLPQALCVSAMAIPHYGKLRVAVTGIPPEPGCTVRRVQAGRLGAKGGLSMPIDAEIKAAVVAMRSIRTKGAKVHEAARL
jgi:hypothetical protein